MAERINDAPQQALPPTPKKMNSSGSLGHKPPHHLGGGVSTLAPAASASASAKRLYRATAGENKWVTRDIASLDFLLGIPLAAEREIVNTGWQLKKDDEELSDSSEHYNKQGGTQITSKGTWWEKWVKSEAQQLAASNTKNNTSNNNGEAAELEQPTQFDSSHNQKGSSSSRFAPFAPGRRLEGDEAVRIQIPLATAGSVNTKQRSIARQAALREWELSTAHGLTAPPLLNGRLFFSANSSYPVSVFSLIRYEPKKEEAAIRRRKLEAIGGGGSQFVLPVRDWRGISYRALLPRGGDDRGDSKTTFNRFVRDSKDGLDDDSSTSSASSNDSDIYAPGLLDDPGMVLGRHRNVMIGDRVTGPVVASTIQFVKPALLKAELNKQFRERFDGWEPPKSQRKYIGARVIQGNYVLQDQTEEYDEQSYERRRRVGSVASMCSVSDGLKEKTIRMPPSLTLSKIRSLKQQALQAAVRARLEIGTVALAFVYFERLCLDCRVDKSNRRLTFAACLLLASKINEPNAGLVTQKEDDADSDDEARSGMLSMIRPNKRSNKMFASLLLFFTQDWSLSLTHLFHAEWGVFAALGFKLHATPSQVAFHFKRLMKTLEWSPLDYLGSIMYKEWQKTVADEEERRSKRGRREEARRKQKEERLLNRHIEIENEVFLRRKNERLVSNNSDEKHQNRPPQGMQKGKSDTELVPTVKKSMQRKGGSGDRRIKLFNRFALRRSASQERLKDREHDRPSPNTEHGEALRRRSANGVLPHCPSMPTLATAFSETGIVAIDIPVQSDVIDSDASTIGSQNESYKDGIIV